MNNPQRRPAQQNNPGGRQQGGHPQNMNSNVRMHNAAMPQQNVPYNTTSPNVQRTPDVQHGSPVRIGAQPNVKRNVQPVPKRAAKPKNTAVTAKPKGSKGGLLGMLRSNAPDMIKSSDRVLYKGSIDMVMLMIILLLVCYGAVMVFSASYASAYNEHGDSYHYIKLHIMWILIGGAALFAATLVNIKFIRHVTIYYYVVCLALMCIVPVLGISQGEATRWIIIAGIRLQPSEMMKLGLVLILALYYDRFEKEANCGIYTTEAIFGFFIPFGIVASVCVLIALESHFSGLIIMFMIGMIVMFAAGAQKIWFVIGGVAAGVLVLLAITLTGYARQRIDMWLHPENYSTLEGIWQTVQGLNAVGSGGLFGSGLGKSTQKHLFVSEPQNDFIFSIICEELGFIGALAVILLFAAFIIRGFKIALGAPDVFSKLTVIGIISKVGLQAILNIAVVTNVIPNTGITLPFFSYGGTAFMMLLGEMGIVLCISKYSYKKPEKAVKKKQTA